MILPALVLPRRGGLVQMGNTIEPCRTVLLSFITNGDLGLILYPETLLGADGNKMSLKQILNKENQPDCSPERGNISAKVMFNKQIIQHGKGTEFVRAGDKVITAYTAWFRDPAKKANKGPKFDQKDDFEIEIGTGKAIEGWDVEITGMFVGEKSRLTIPSDMAYKERGYAELIPSNTSLLFEVELKRIKKTKSSNRTCSNSARRSLPDILTHQKGV